MGSALDYGKLAEAMEEYGDLARECSITEDELWAVLRIMCQDSRRGKLMDVTLEYKDYAPVLTHEVEGVTISSDDCAISVSVNDGVIEVKVVKGIARLEGLPRLGLNIRP